MPRAKKNKLSEKIENISASKITRSLGSLKSFKKQKREPMTPINFIITVLWGTVGALTIILIFSVYATIIFFGSLRWVDTTEAFYQGNNIVEQSDMAITGNIFYNADKIFYRINDMIKLDIINDTNVSIYLAPCNYFNEFEKKTSDGWQPKNLEVCNDSEVPDNSFSIDKVNKKIDFSFSAKDLGAGTWRGVLTAYFGCKIPNIESCINNSKIVYTQEFAISR